MSSYLVSARKYRPLEFSEVVGQQSITDTLQKAIDNDHLAQALLFCGPRGVGKTTCARIVARKINEKVAGEHHDDFSFNIFELDAASNNSVEDIRSLIDQVRFPPQVGQYKVYIIDEVHMLSKAAFNAFLKTLEEPPAHAVFILATTEKHKIIPTILSRCQIFDFKRIQVKDMVAQLTKIAEDQQVSAEEDALHLIATKADGAMRDALSIFDQMVTFSPQGLTYKSVAQNLNVLDYEYYITFTEYFLQGDIPQALLKFDEVLRQGFDEQMFVGGLAAHFRDLLVAKNQQTVELLELSSGLKQKYLEQAQNCSTSFLIDAIQIAQLADVEFKTTQNPRLRLEIALMQLASLTETGDKKKSLI